MTDSIAVALEWIRVEQEAYAKRHGEGKYGDEREEEARVAALQTEAYESGAGRALEDDNGWWLRMSNYASRALLLDVVNDGGLQALGKLASTAVAMFAAAVRLAEHAQGDRGRVILPAPGYASGELRDWEIALR